MNTRWGPGRHKLLVWEQGMALLDCAVTDDQAERIWLSMRKDSQLGSFLQVLMEATGQGLLSLSPFAVAIRSERGIHVAVRGPLQVRVHTEESVVDLAGEHVTTWDEKMLPGASRVELLVDAAAGRGLPMLAGIAEASWVGWSADETVAPPSQQVMPGAAGPQDAVSALEVPVVEPLHVGAEPAAEPEDAPEPVSVPRRSEADPMATLLPEQPPMDEDANPAEEPPHRAGGVYAFLFDDTAAEDVAAAAIRDTPGPGGNPAAVQPGESPIHDGLTVAGEDDEMIPVAVGGSSGPQVLAAHCERGHPNPPQRGECYTCGSAVVGQSRKVPRPQLGWLQITGGERVPLRGPVVAGRNPKTVAITSAESPRLVAIPQPHVSSNHVAFLLEGWTVLVRDLGSSNGTYLRRHNKPPVRLPEHDTPLIPGDVIDLGHGVFINLDRIP